MSDDRRLKLSSIVQQSKEEFLLKTELYAVLAKEVKAKFDAYVSEGFTNEQALELCCAELRR